VFLFVTEHCSGMFRSQFLAIFKKTEVTANKNIVKEFGNQYHSCTCNNVARKMYNINYCSASKRARIFTYCGQLRAMRGAVLSKET
jgi:hypothetical protein